MARPPKKNKGFLKKKQTKEKHNWKNDCRDKHRMLDMKRERYFRLDLKDILEKSENQDNKNIFAANILTKAAKSGIDDSIDYIERLKDKGLESHIVEELKKLLKRYSTYR